MKKTTKRILFSVLAIICAVCIAVGGYVAYVCVQYYRIEDNLMLSANGMAKDESIKKGVQYTVLTYNVGFGAYDKDYTFFMDSGTMLDGTEVTGKYGKAMSKTHAENNTTGSLDIIKSYNADFYLLQEVDEKATRSFNVNQRQIFTDAFTSHESVFAQNFHSAFLALPLNDFHGKTLAGLLTLSNVKSTENIRRSYPVDNAFPTRFFDLDRCFTVSRYPVEGGSELVMINSHMSAYDEGGTIRTKQLELINQVLEQEAAKGNYVIIGGDFNHALSGTKAAFNSQQQVPKWVYEIENENLTNGYHVVDATNAKQVATCRAAEIPYQKGVNYETVVDGFIASENINATALNLDEGYLYSDHNPVLLTFKIE